MTMRCPECGSRDLRVSADITCIVEQREIGGQVMDVIEATEGGELYWDRDSWTVCQAEGCGHSGEAKLFERTERPCGTSKFEEARAGA
jgi:hypothetical protein